MDALEHGTLNTYVNRRCRCANCKAASSAYCRALYRRRAYGRVVELVDVDQVRTHLRWLASHGIGWEQVPQLAGVGRNTVDQILRPTRRRRGVTPGSPRRSLTFFRPWTTPRPVRSSTRPEPGAGSRRSCLPATP